MKLIINHCNIAPKGIVEIKKNEYYPLSILHSFFRKYTYRNDPFFPNKVDKEKLLFLWTWSKGEYSDEIQSLKKIREDIYNKSYLDLKNILYFNGWSNGLSEMLRRENELTISRRLRTKDIYISGHGLFGTVNSLQQICPIYYTVFHKNNFIHLINSILENEELPNNLLEIWVNKKLYERGSIYHNNIKAQIKNRINEYKASGIKILQIDKDPIFYNTHIPNFKNLEEKYLWIKELYGKLKNKQRPVEVNQGTMTSSDIIFNTSSPDISNLSGTLGDIIVGYTASFSATS